MKHTLRSALSATVLLGLCSLPSGLSAASGEVFVTGSTWTGRVDGSTKYTGSSMAAAANACVAAMSSGTITIKNSGAKNGTITISKNNITIDGTGRTISGGGTTGIVYAANRSNVGGRNINMSSSDWYGMFFRTCNGVNVSGTGGTANLGFRIDNCKGGTGFNLTVGSPTSNTSGSYGSHFVETYGISGVSWGTITATTRTDGCGTLLNFSTNATGTANTATRACWGCGYAGFRTANTNGKTTLGTVTSTSCGRGFFSVSGSRDCTISTIQTHTTSSHGVWLQTTYNSRVNSGTVRSGNPCSSITAGSGNVVSVSCQ